MNDELELPELHRPSRWELIRDAIVLQGKLFVDGLRDLVMGPVSLFAALLDLLGIGRRSGRYFYDVVLLGRQTEKWIDLFSAAEHVLPPGYRGRDKEGLDLLVDRVESIVVQEYQKGGMTKSAKEAVDRALDSLDQRIERGRSGDKPGPPPT